MRKTLKVFSNIVTVVLFINLILIVCLVISSKASGGEPQIFGYQVKTVLSGSMEPTFMTGSVIAVKPLNQEESKSLAKDDIITFQTADGMLITHRVMDVVKSGDQVMYETKGDNNNAPDLDLVLSDNVRGQYANFTVPYIGYFFNFSQSKAGSAILMVVPGLLLLGYAGYTIYTTLREIDSKVKKADNEKPA
ncbi:signal peptidase I SipW [Lederbergia ruris]|uniref:Signal peptidase I n=1 Tax=Lederbergia ruris TaxID=217495 RepID=A0ABQ4KHD8_9BACI|nr:signal peptidase I [Lederbergia ruris]GIN57366.1 S26 family signal peptidase [Lederbergia ruris]